MRGAGLLIAALALALALGGCRTGPLAEAFCLDDPLPSGVRIEGNQAVKDRELVEAAAFELENLRKGEGHESDVADAAWSMERHLASRGYAGSKVDYSFADGTATFRVREGKRAHLRSVRLRGVHALDEGTLLEYFDLPGEGPLGLPPVLYDESLLEDAAGEVALEYRLNGFQDVEISGPHTSWSEEGGCADVVFDVEEGRRYCVCEVTVDGVCSCPLGLRGQPYRARLTTQAAGKVRGDLLARGHQFAKVEARAELEEETGCANIHVEAEPGPPVLLRRVCIRQLERTRWWFARSLIPLRSGMLLRQARIDQGVQQLYRAGIFRSVDANVAPVGDDTADLVVDLPELEARRVELQAGWGSYERARVGVGFEDRNLFGIGRAFRSEIRGHTRGGELALELVDPWIFGPRRKLQFDVDLVRREEPSYTFEGIHTAAFAEERVLDWLTLRGGYRFRSERAFDVRGAIPQAEMDGFVNSAGLFADVEVDTRDSALLPTRGTLARLGVFWSAPVLGADLSFTEYTGGVTHHVPLGALVMAVGGAFRVKDPRGDASTLPIQERYFLDGEDSVRSFEEAELGPVNAARQPLGGHTSAQAHAEVRFPLGLGELHGAVFYDIGVVNQRAFDFSGPFGHALGVGLRYYFPFGPVRLDFAWGPGERFAAEDRWAAHLALGFSF